MKNKKGFSLVELLAVIAILGILFGLGVAAYDRYTTKAYEESMDILAKSSISAAESYLADYPGETEVNLDTLVKYNYLENNKDPRDKTSPCSGTVRITPEVTDDPDAIDNYIYAVDICCISGNYRYDDNGTRVKTSLCGAEFQEEQYIENDSSQCTSAKTKTKKINIYTMNYLGKTCTKNASNEYSNCTDSQGNNPCRRYDYHLRQCVCRYNKTSNKYCSSAISATGADDHKMKIRYYDNSNGQSSCASEEPSSFNSYVEKVCTYGTYENYGLADNPNIMGFHGYQFFKEKSVGYSNFNPEGTWFHDPISGITLEDRVQRIDQSDGSIDYEQGCRSTCIRFTEYLSGPVN